MIKLARKFSFITVDYLELTTRAENLLLNNGIMYVWQLIQKSRSELSDIKGMGMHSLREIEIMLNECGMSLRKE